MKKMLKITGWVFAVLVVLAVILLVAAKLLITPERVKKTVLPVAEKALNRQVSIGEISISLFSGISIKDFNVMMREEDETFVSAESLVLRYKLWPLLKKQVAVDDLRLINPDIRAVRYKDGAFNFSDLLEDKEEAGAYRPGKTVEASVALAQENSPDPAIDLMVNQVQIKGGSLSFIDKAAADEPLTSRVDNLELSARNISLKGSFPFELKASLSGAPVSVSGTADAASRKVRADARIKGLDALDFEPYFSDRVPGRISSAKLSLDTTIETDADKVSSTGTLRADEVDMVLDALPDAPFENTAVVIDHDLAAELGAQNLKLRSINADLNGISMNAAGNVSYGSAPEIDISLELPETDVKKIMAAMPEEYSKMASEADPSGKIQAEIRLAGAAAKPKQLLQSGRVRLDSAGVMINDLKTAASGNIILSADRILSRETELKLGGDTASLDFEITEFLSDPIRINNKVTAKRLDLDRLIEAAGGAGAKDPENGKKDGGKAGNPGGPENGGNSSQKQEAGTFDLPIRAEGQIQVQEASYRELPMNDLLINYTLIDNVFTMESFSARVAEGGAKADASINLGQKDMEYRANLLLENIKSSEVINAMYPKAGWLVSGTADLSGDFSGRGIRMSDIEKTLTGQSDFEISNGGISGGQITGELASMLGAGSLKTVDFDSFKGNLKIERGKVKVEGDFDGKDMKMKPSGIIGLDGSLDLSLNLRVAPGFSDRLSGDSLAGRLMADKEGWTRLPVSVSGTANSPKFILDRSVVKQQLKEKGTEKLIEEGIKKFFK
ncbi:MAG: AsmA family protein [Desulfobacterales bacterium]